MEDTNCSLFERLAPLWIDVTSPPPPQVITFVAAGGTRLSKIRNFSTGIYRMIFSAIISSLSEKILTQVVKCTTSRDIWHIGRISGIGIVIY